MKLLSIENISYRDILFDISFVIEKPLVFCLLGYNGSGKTTLIDIITNNLRPSKGKYSILEQNFDHAKKDIGVLYDEISFYRSLKVREIIKLYEVLYDVIDKNHEIELLKTFGIDHLLNKFLNVLSKGEQKKVGLFLSMLHKPKFLILDEPTSNLDPNIRETIWLSIKKNKDLGIFFTTHYWDEAQKYSDLVCFMHKGKLLTKPNSPDFFLSKPFFPYTQKIIVNTNFLEDIENCFIYKKSDTTFILTDNTDFVLKKINTKNYSVVDVGLEDVYAYLISKQSKQSL